MERDEEEESVFEVYEKDGKIHIEMNEAFEDKFKNSEKGYERETIYNDAVYEICWEFKRYLEKYSGQDHVEKVRAYLAIIKNIDKYWDYRVLDEFVDEGREIVYKTIFDESWCIAMWLEEVEKDDDGVLFHIEESICL